MAQPTVPGLRSILTILGCQPYNLQQRSRPTSRRPSAAAPDLGRRSSAASSPPVQHAGLDGIPLHKTVSSPVVGLEGGGTKGLGKVEEADEGKAIWFSTREETLSEQSTSL